jgi:hypothetical protein
MYGKAENDFERVDMMWGAPAARAVASFRQLQVDRDQRTVAS